MLAVLGPRMPPPPPTVVSTCVDAGNRPHLRLDRVDHFLHRRDADAFGRVDAGFEFRFVDVGRDVVLLHQVVERHVRGDHGDRPRAAPAQRNRIDCRSKNM